jgi:hypothetical protein
MKRSLVRSFWGGLIVLFSLFLVLVSAAPLGTAAQLQQARVSQVIQDVRVLETHGAPRPAAVNDKVTQGMGVRTNVHRSDNNATWRKHDFQFQTGNA